MMDAKYKKPLAILAIIIVVILAYVLLTMPDQRSASEKIGDAVNEMSEGADKAARQLEDRTSGQQLGDAVKDTGEKIKENTAP